jgi:hypothetical protein
VRSERLSGLLLFLAGTASLAAILLMQRAGWFQPTRLPLPAGLRPELVPVLTPLACVAPLATLGALGLCLLGLRKLLAPDDWEPPKHLG